MYSAVSPWTAAQHADLLLTTPYPVFSY
eukprot:COSAG02_NODE_51246_length_315_cov_0.884259_2_plen_27_part_01